jgi:ParB/RepB/Spo0J family partition protein
MSAIEKTKSIERRDIKMSLLVKNDQNPNKMGKREFDMLVQNIQDTGITDPILVRPLEDGRYRIVGGHHRFDAAEYLDFEEVPCTVINDPSFDADSEKFQIVRMNMIRGRLDPEKFLKLYDSLDKKYEAEVMADAFGFADEQMFKKLIGQMASSLPKTMQTEFKKAAEEIKTIDGLSKLLNQMFTKYGDTLPYGYMLLDFGGKDSVWLRMNPVDKARFTALADRCRTSKRSVDSLFRLFMQSVADGGQEQLFASLMTFPEIEVQEGKLPIEG